MTIFSCLLTESITCFSYSSLCFFSNSLLKINFLPHLFNISSREGHDNHTQIMWNPDRVFLLMNSMQFFFFCCNLAMGKFSSVFRTPMAQDKILQKALNIMALQNKDTLRQEFLSISPCPAVRRSITNWPIIWKNWWVVFLDIIIESDSIARKFRNRMEEYPCYCLINLNVSCYVAFMPFQVIMISTIPKYCFTSLEFNWWIQSYTRERVPHFIMNLIQWEHRWAEGGLLLLARDKEWLRDRGTQGWRG